MSTLRATIFALALGGALTSSLAAQRTTRLGVLGGINLANLSGDVDGDTRTGFILGGFAALPLAENVAFETGLLYSQRGAKAAAAGVTASIRLDYVEIPAVAVVRFPGSSSVTPFIGGGAAVAFKVGCGFKISAIGASLSGGCDDVEDELGTRLKGTDLGLVGQGGIDIDDLRLMVRYNLGLSGITGGTVGEAIRNRTLSLLVGYGFRLR